MFWLVVVGNIAAFFGDEPPMQSGISCSLDIDIEVVQSSLRWVSEQFRIVRHVAVNNFPKFGNVQ